MKMNVPRCVDLDLIVIVSALVGMGFASGVQVAPSSFASDHGPFPA